jgi:hypothetical protein
MNAIHNNHDMLIIEISFLRSRLAQAVRFVSWHAETAPHGRLPSWLASFILCLCTIGATELRVKPGIAALHLQAAATDFLQIE